MYDCHQQHLRLLCSSLILILELLGNGRSSLACGGTHAVRTILASIVDTWSVLRFGLAPRLIFKQVLSTDTFWCNGSSLRVRHSSLLAVDELFKNIVLTFQLGGNRAEQDVLVGLEPFFSLDSHCAKCNQVHKHHAYHHNDCDCDD